VAAGRRGWPRPPALRHAGLLAAAGLAGCAHYAKLQNPSPIEDLESSVRMESLAHVDLSPRWGSAIALRVRVEVPARDRVGFADTIAVLFDGRDSTRVVGYGVRARDSAGPAPEPADLYTSGTTVSFTLPVRAAGWNRLAAGRTYLLRLAWRQGPLGTEPLRPERSRLYRFRIQRVSFAPMIALGAVPIGILLSVLSR
jgi:hypothetical protein